MEKVLEHWMKNLWPEDLGENPQKSPKKLLLDQAVILRGLTKNVVTADVIKRSVTNPDSTTFNYSFVLITPAMGGYSFSLFNFDHPVELYPVKIIVDAQMKASLPELFSKDRAVKAKDEEEFIEVVGEIFKSSRTKEVIGGLISQSANR
jgi:hypothetical protein